MSAGERVDELAKLLSTLRAPGGCPWDREQTSTDIAEFMLEEAYECHFAAQTGIPADLSEELGDVLLQVVFMSQIASEENQFDLETVASKIVAKIRRRHPHIFGDEVAGTSDEVNVIWEKVKQQEGKSSRPVFPALEEARKIQCKAEKKKFNSPDPWKMFELAATRLLAERVPGEVPASNRRTTWLLAEVLFAAVRLGSLLGRPAERLLREKNADFSGKLEALKTRGYSPEKGGEELWQNS